MAFFVVHDRDPRSAWEARAFVRQADHIDAFAYRILAEFSCEAEARAFAEDENACSPREANAARILRANREAGAPDGGASIMRRDWPDR